MSTETYIAGYRIDRVIGTGGMGTVYLAQNPTLPRHDALKVLSAQLSVDAGFRARFWREADVTSRLQHPNIVSIYRRGQTETGQLWIAMQYVDGTDADAALRAGTMTADRAVYIIGEVAQALDHAHRHRVIHRDIKPANILLSSQGAPERVLLSDFGIARALDDVSLTVTGSVMATAAYAAPEVFGSGAIDHRADVYSLGCTLFRLVTGKTPYPVTGGMAAAMIAHLEQPPPRVTAHMPGLPPALDQVIFKGLAKDPAERYQSAGELARAALAAVRGIGPSAVTAELIPSSEVSSYPHTPGPTSDDRRVPDVMDNAVAAHTMAAPFGVSPPRDYSALPVRRGRRGRVVAIVSAAALLTAGALTAVALGARSHEHPSAGPAPSPPPTVVRSGELREFLLSSDEISAVMEVRLDPQPVSLGLDASSDILDEKECAGSWAPGMVAAYTGTGWLGAAEQIVNEPAKPYADQKQVLLPREATQVVVSFQSAERAAAFLANEKSAWERCANRTVTLHFPNQPVNRLNLGVPAFSPDKVLTTTNGYEGAMDNKCSRALSVRSNVSIDVDACGRGNTEEQAVTIMNKIAAKVAHQ